MRALGLGATLPLLLQGADVGRLVDPDRPARHPRRRFADLAVQLAGDDLPGRGRAGGDGRRVGERPAGRAPRREHDPEHLAVGVVRPGTSRSPADPGPPASPGQRRAAPAAPARRRARRPARRRLTADPGRRPDAGVRRCALGGFDTHAGERTTHDRLMAELDAAVSGFLAGLAGSPAGERVVLATYSEFGRRVAANASGGTDHGTAAPLFVAGPAGQGRVLRIPAEPDRPRPGRPEVHHRLPRRVHDAHRRRAGDGSVEGAQRQDVHPRAVPLAASYSRRLDAVRHGDDRAPLRRLPPVAGHGRGSRVRHADVRRQPVAVGGLLFADERRGHRHQPPGPRHHRDQPGHPPSGGGRVGGGASVQQLSGGRLRVGLASGDSALRNIGAPRRHGRRARGVRARRAGADRGLDRRAGGAPSSASTGSRIPSRCRSGWPRRGRAPSGWPVASPTA